MTTVLKRKNQTSIIGSVCFSKWVKEFDVNTPSLLAAVSARNQESKVWIDNLQWQMTIAEREYQNVRVNV